MDSEEPKPGQLDPEQIATEKFNVAVLERLRNLTPNFLRIRASMGIGPDVGLGSFPESHGVYSVGTIVTLKKDPKNGALLYTVPDGFLGSAVYKPFSPGERSKIAVMPENTALPRVVSIYQKAGYQEERRFEERLLTAPDEVYEGVIAHELAHMFDFGVSRPRFVDEVLQKREGEFMDLRSKSGIRELVREFDLSGEARFDIIASLFGYKNQILAKLRYMKDCLKTYKDANDAGFSHLKPAGKATLEIDVREKEVKRYCP